MVRTYQQYQNNKQTGFTMVELVVVLVIIGILSSVGLSRFSSTNSFHERGFTDESLTAIRYAHRLATSSGCHVQVSLDNNNLQISRWSSCKPADHSLATSLLRHPKNTGDFSNPVPGGTVLTNTNFYFDGTGKPFDTSSESALTTVTNISIGSHLIKLEPETGFSHQ